MKTLRLSSEVQDLEKAAELLRKGEVVGVPSETVYGLAGDANRADAVQKIFEAKGRPSFDPLIVHIPRSLHSTASLAQAQWLDLTPYSPDILFRLDRLMKKFWPGPLTLVLKKNPRVLNQITSGHPDVALRMPLHPVFQNLLDLCGFPLAAPSANQFGKLSPTSADAVERELGGKISAIIDGGPCGIGVESTILQLTPTGELRLLRPGGLELEKIEAEWGEKITRPEKAALPHSETPVVAPGMLDSHYAPRKKLLLLPQTLEKTLPHLPLDWKLRLAPLREGLKIGFLGWSAWTEKRAELWNEIFLNPPLLHFSLIENASAEDTEKAARHLFQRLRTLDEAPVDWIVAEPPPHPKGLAPAILDRLTRASVREFFTSPV